MTQEKKSEEEPIQFSLNIPGLEQERPAACPKCNNVITISRMFFTKEDEMSHLRGNEDLKPEKAIGCIRCSDECCNCDNIRFKKDLKSTKSGKACSECSTTCGNCDEDILNEDIVISNRGGRSRVIGCNNCLSQCDSCSRYYDREEMQNVSGIGIFCEDCYNDKFISCDDCNSTENKESSYFVDSGGYYVCDSCFNRNYSSCYSCNEIFHDSDLHIFEGDSYCSSCVPEDEEMKTGSIESFNEFSYTPKDKFLQILNKLVPITVRELEDKHPRLANGLPDLIQLAGGRRSKGIINAELINSYRNNLNPESFPVRFTTWDSSLQRSRKVGNPKENPQIVMVIIANEQFLNKMTPVQKKFFELVNIQSNKDTHPIVQDGIGWARLEPNQEEKYILVDEIQSDHSGKAYKFLNHNSDYFFTQTRNLLKSQFKISNEDLVSEIKNYAKLFEEFPSIAIQAISNYAKSNDYKKIYWHTYESGKKLKGNFPPVELYSKVPKEHSFIKSTEKPFDLEGLFFEREAKKQYLLFKVATKMALKYIL